MKKIAILGSTGSIGTQALEIIKENPELFSASVLTCGANVEKLSEQIKLFQPDLVVTAAEDDAIALSRKYPHLEVLFGMDGLAVAAAKGEADLVLNALMGMRGLIPTYCAIEAGKDIAFANKETLVAGGEVIMPLIKEKGVAMLPVDSEHSAIFQALQGNQKQQVKRLILTASGGPFRGYTKEQLEQVTLAQALQHPNWSMGKKITIDSATMMNKGLEVIEAKHLFAISADHIEVVVHRESIIHSMVEYVDHSIIAQMGVPDMRVPISYAFTYPDRIMNEIASVDFFALGSISFEQADTTVFPCLTFAYEAIKAGGSYPVVLNAANEVLVEQFLENKICFVDIPRTLEKVLQQHQPSYQLSLEEILEIDRKVRGDLEI